MSEKIRFSVVCVCLILSFAVMPSGEAYAKRELRGKIYMVGEKDEDIPSKNTTIRIEESDDSDVSTDTAAFRLFIKDHYKTDETVTLKVEKTGYQIWQPVAGKVRIPANLENYHEKVRLDKLGSHRFMSNQAFAMLIEKAARESTKTVSKSDEKPDLSRYLKEWAVKYGFGIDDVKTELDKWAADIEKRQDNLYELGLAEFYKKNFGEAAEKFTQSAQQHEQELAKVREKENALKAKVIRDYRLAGDSHYNNYHFQDSLTSYQKALSAIDKAKTPEMWADVMNKISNTYQNLGIRVEGQAAQHHLANAIKSYRELLTIQTKEINLQNWAAIQNNMGNALQEQGTRTGGEEGAKLLSQGVEAFRAALTVYTRETLPQDWAMTQNNVGAALRNQGTRTGGEEGAKLLSQAVNAYRAALTVRTRETLPQDWAMIQNNMGIALSEQGIHTGGEEGAKLLSQGVEAFRAALTVYTRETLPQDWATTQSNMGGALQEQGTRTDGEEGAKLLSQAMNAYRAALTVRTRETLPQNWATTQSNMGETIREQAILAPKEKKQQLFKEAITALNHALEIWTYQHLPGRWATAQKNLADTYFAMEDWAKAEECYANVLKVNPADEKAIERLKLIREKR